MERMSAVKPRISAFWIFILALVLVLAFVLPNHYFPWSSFHAEALGAAALLLPAIWISYFTRTPVRIYASNLILILAILVALSQYVFGLIPLWGTFWITAVYLFGFLVALHIGEIWEQVEPGQCLDYLSLAFIIASLVSLPLEVFQWLDISWSTPLIMQARDIQRPFANMAQPNLLADMYLLGIIGLSWQLINKRLNGLTTSTLTALLLFGVAITGSRAAWINVGTLLLLATFFRPSLAANHSVRVVLGLGIFFFCCALGAPKLQAALVQGDALNTLRNFSTASAHSRLLVWKMMLLASLLSPVWGYGWGQVIKVNFVFDDAMGVERGLFSYSHNFFLDLVLWNGYPLGLMFSAAAIWWIWRLIRLDRNMANWHIQASVLVLCIHSLAEFPIYYSYFLFPIGLMLGSVQPLIFSKPVLTVSHWARWTGLAICLAALSLSVRDYFLVERNFYALRFESRGYLTDVTRKAPDGWVLTQLVEHLRFSRSEPNPAATPAQLAEMEDIVRATPGAYIIFKLALNYGLVGNEEKARFWLNQICKKAFEQQCEEAQQKWQMASKLHPDQKLIPWPLPIKVN